VKTGSSLKKVNDKFSNAMNSPYAIQKNVKIVNGNLYIRKVRFLASLYLLTASVIRLWNANFSTANAPRGKAGRLRLKKNKRLKR
jgi:hypothetical protein